MPARFFVDENDLALGRALRDSIAMSSTPGIPIFQKYRVVHSMTSGCPS